MSFDVAAIRKDFPLIQRAESDGVSYLDTGATSLKPQAVIDAVTKYYTEHTASIHRGVYKYSELTTLLYEATRSKAAKWIGARDLDELVFTSGTTLAMNLLAYGLPEKYLKQGASIVVTELEHHANIVPWYECANRNGMTLVPSPILDSGAVDLEAFERNVSRPEVTIAAFSFYSNVMGNRLPVESMVKICKQHDVLTIVDGAQAMLAERFDVQNIDCDFLVFSGHKMLAPSGIGMLYGKSKLLQRLKPLITGGAMIHTVSFEKVTYAPPPARFEAGTPPIEAAIGLGAAFDYLEELDWDGMLSHKQKLLDYGHEVLGSKASVKLIGDSSERSQPVFSFTLAGVHPHDIGSLCDAKGVAIRVGHHCCQPLMKRFSVPATARASLAFYNTCDEIDALSRGLDYVEEVFK